MVRLFALSSHPLAHHASYSFLHWALLYHHIIVEDWNKIDEP